MLLSVLLKQYDCFASNVTLYANLQTYKLSILLYPSEQEYLDCKNQDGKNVEIEVLFPSVEASQLPITVKTTNLTYKYQYGITLVYELAYSSNSQFNDIIERIQAVYKFCIDDKTVCISSSVSVLNHVQFNGQGCWNNVKMTYDFWSAEQYFQIAVEPNQCDAGSAVDAYLYYQNNNLDYDRVQIYPNNSLDGGYHSVYDHMNTLIFQYYKSKYSTSADSSGFEKFVEHFDKSKNAVLYLVVEYEAVETDGRKYRVQLQTQIRQYSTPDSVHVRNAELQMFNNKGDIVIAYNPAKLINGGFALYYYQHVNFQVVFQNSASVNVYLEASDTISGFTSKLGRYISYSDEVAFDTKSAFVTQVFVQFKDADDQTKNEIVALISASYSCIYKLYVELNEHGICYRALLYNQYPRCYRYQSGQVFIQLSSIAESGDSTTKVAYLAYISDAGLQNNVKRCFTQGDSVDPVKESQVDTGDYKSRIQGFSRVINRKQAQVIQFRTASEFVFLETALLDNFKQIYIIFGVIIGLLLVCVLTAAGLMIKSIK